MAPAAPSSGDAAACAAAAVAAAALLQPLIEAAVARVYAPGAELARRPREAVQPVRRCAPGEADLTCHAAVACWRHARAADAAVAERYDDAAQLAEALLAALAAAAGDALQALLSDARVAPDGTLLLTTRGAAAAAAATGALRCGACGRCFAGKRALRNHSQSVHADGYAASVAAVTAATAALALRRAAPDAVTQLPHGAEALHPGLAAARDGVVAALRALHARGWDAARCCDRHGSTALLWAAGGGHLEACRFLVHEAGCDAAAAQPRDGRTALHWAARNGHTAVVAWLVEHAGCDAAAGTRDGTTALQWAVWRGHLHTVDWLAARCADWRGANAYGCAAPHWAAMRDENAPAICDWLHARGADWRAANAAGHAPLHKAAMRGHVRVLAWLLRHADGGAPLNAPDADGNTPLALAALWGERDAAAALLDHGALLDATGPVRCVRRAGCMHVRGRACDARRIIRRAARRRWRGRASWAMPQ
jgi:ankyrin repeat protein